jgi:hypothetical protein
MVTSMVSCVDAGERERELFALGRGERVAARLRHRVDPAHLDPVDGELEGALIARPRALAVHAEALGDAARQRGLQPIARPDPRVTALRPLELVHDVARLVGQAPGDVGGAAHRGDPVREVGPHVLDEHLGLVILRHGDRVRAAPGVAVVGAAARQRAILDGERAARERHLGARQLALDEGLDLLRGLFERSADGEVGGELDAPRGDGDGLLGGGRLIERLPGLTGRELVVGGPTTAGGGQRAHEGEGRDG